MARKPNNPAQHTIVHNIAEQALADPRTVQKVLNGQAVRGAVGDRIRKAVDAWPKPKPKGKGAR